MKGLFFSVIFMLAPLTTLVGQDVVGKWELRGGTANGEFDKDGGVYNGKIVWL